MSVHRVKSRSGRSQVDSPTSQSGHSTKSNLPSQKISDKTLAEDQADGKVPGVHRENTLAWKFISSEQISDLIQLTVDGVQKLAEILQLSLFEYCMKQGILLDYYVSGFWWAKEQNFTMIQISTFMTLLKTILANVGDAILKCQNTSQDHHRNEKRLSLLDNLKELKNIMAKIVQSSSEKSDDGEFFTVDQGKAIISYMKISLFQHYKLYEFLYNQTPDIQILDTKETKPKRMCTNPKLRCYSCFKLDVEVIKSVDPFPSPLEESLTWDIYSSYVLSQSPEEFVEEAAVEAEESNEEAQITPVDPLAGYTIDDVKSILGEITADVLRNLQTEINERLQKQEEAYTVRINKLIQH
ncbi:ciliary-associated calcium-binding coiled-coil protein 1 isoform X2 [Rhincodon typus]|uniref:ciliary-associated calcium-binding coiled-coil protein 1 isoform X2 n=1 Tax=Rhincodon typus TaxID=259920 RepID=UPI00203056D3|nr:ciliary-associated calcium-binding coiled-coil protein 1 isoform X2 [Rhincodon typus]